MGYIYPTSTTNVSDSFNDHRDRTPPSANPGTDYTAAYGSDVWSVADGVVTDTDGNPDGSGGRMIHIDNDDGTGADYLHLSALSVSLGDRVVQGQRIAFSGASGFGSNYGYGPHLHISFRPNHSHGFWNDGNIDFDALMRGTTSAGGVGTILEDDMPDMNTFLNTPAYDNGPTISQVLKESHNVYAGVYGGGPSVPGGTSIVKLIDSIPARVWATTVLRGGKKISALQELADAKTVALRLEAENAALSQALAAVSLAKGVIDPAAIQAAAKEGAADALKALTLKAQ